MHLAVETQRVDVGRLRAVEQREPDGRLLLEAAILSVQVRLALLRQVEAGEPNRQRPLRGVQLKVGENTPEPRSALT